MKIRISPEITESVAELFYQVSEITESIRKSTAKTISTCYQDIRRSDSFESLGCIKRKRLHALKPFSKHASRVFITKKEIK